LFNITLTPTLRDVIKAA
jgi:hypothetical protein